ncbi:MAG: bifunctional diguanylate cyclase/phosphodiesterase [Lachnospiraceae bacterium]|nr:bifunctional diguanylate cyclase/phosphodiesterase [Lachnospiraceae bacterium]
MKLSRKGKAYCLMAGTLVCFVLQMLIMKTPNGGSILLQLGGKASMVNITGVIQAIMALICIILVLIDARIGLIIARVILLISVVSMVLAVIRSGGGLTPLPGAVTVLMSLLSCEIIARQFKQMEMDSITDLVTKLLNRRGLIKELEAQQADSKHFHMMFLHVNNLKSINDNLGYEYGDKALAIIADRISKVVSKGSIVSKLDGTEYAIAIPENDDIKLIADEIMNEVNKKIVLDSDGVPANFYLRGFAGVATYPEDTNSILKLLRYADIAMYHASKNNKERIVYFNKSLEEELLRRAQVEGYIQESLKNDYFFLVYQPQFRAEDKGLRGFETLIRMKLPDGTNISPGEFIPIAEKTDLIYKIDEYVLRRALTEFKNAILTSGDKLLLSVNISAKDISSPDFAGKLARILEETGFPAEHLEIEITEYSLYDSLETTVANIERIRGMGAKLALDDFGTGYTSLAQLLHLPFDLLKVDKSLVDNVETSEVSRDFVKLVIYMGHIMNSEVISEGVESESQLKLLREQNCDFIQGYVWSRPLALQDALDMCR